MDLNQCFLTFFGLRHPYKVLQIVCGTPRRSIRQKDQEIVFIVGAPGTSLWHPLCATRTPVWNHCSKSHFGQTQVTLRIPSWMSWQTMSWTNNIYQFQYDLQVFSTIFRSAFLWIWINSFWFEQLGYSSERSLLGKDDFFLCFVCLVKLDLKLSIQGQLRDNW